MILFIISCFVLEIIGAILSLLLNERASTLKEAINLYETDRYRSNVISRLDLLNENILMLNNNINGLRNDIEQLSKVTYAGFSTLVASNNSIYDALECITYDTRFLAIDAFFN